MSITVEAVWESGVLKPKTRLDLPEKTSVRVIVETSVRSSLGADLRAIRSRIVASGVPLLDEGEILKEIRGLRVA